MQHPITEMITGQDLVQWQLDVAAGRPLPLAQRDIPRVGHAFEARIYAESPRRNFLPQIGRLLHLQTPAEQADLRIETGVASGDDISGESAYGVLD